MNRGSIVLMKVLCQVEQSRLNQVTKWLVQVAVRRGSNDIHILTSPVTTGLGGTGGGRSIGGYVQAAGAHCSKYNVWGVTPGVFVVRCLAMISARIKANHLVRLEFLGEVP